MYYLFSLIMYCKAFRHQNEKDYCITIVLLVLSICISVTSSGNYLGVTVMFFCFFYEISQDFKYV